MGTLWNRSGTIERDFNDFPASGAKAFFYAGGTMTAITVYEDAGEAAAHERPVLSDSRGRWPDVFVPYMSSYDVRVTDQYGTQLSYTQMIPNVNPVEVTVDAEPNTILQTGMILPMMMDTTLAGFVRLNGRTIGSAASGATERANNDTQALFTFLWTNMANDVAPVSGGRGPSAASDFSANRTITLPDLRGGSLAGIDTMGNEAALRFSGLAFSVGDRLRVGSQVGANVQTLTKEHIPAHRHPVARGLPGSGSFTGMAANLDSVIDTTQTTEESAAASTNLNTMQYSRLVTWYIKL